MSNKVFIARLTPETSLRTFILQGLGDRVDDYHVSRLAIKVRGVINILLPPGLSLVANELYAPEGYPPERAISQLSWAMMEVSLLFWDLAHTCRRDLPFSAFDWPSIDSSREEGGP